VPLKKVDVNLSEQKKRGEETWFSKSPFVTIRKDLLESLAKAASKTARGRSRFCTHISPKEKTHEMFIVHPKKAKIPIHSHTNKDESIFILKGKALFYIYSPTGKIKKRIYMGTIASGLPFYQRIPAGVFHSLQICSKNLIFLETTSGPFHRKDLKIIKEK